MAVVEKKPSSGSLEKKASSGSVPKVSPRVDAGVEAPGTTEAKELVNSYVIEPATPYVLEKKMKVYDTGDGRPGAGERVLGITAFDNGGEVENGEGYHARLSMHARAGSQS